MFALGGRSSYQIVASGYLLKIWPSRAGSGVAEAAAISEIIVEASGRVLRSWAVMAAEISVLGG